MKTNAQRQLQGNVDNRQNAAAFPAATRQINKIAARTNIELNRPAGLNQKNLGELANGGARAMQFKALSQLANHSPQAVRQRALVWEINSSPRVQRFESSALVQRTGNGETVQRQIGDHGDQKKVVDRKTGQIYLAKKRNTGSYDLYSTRHNGEQEHALNVAMDDDGYVLFSEYKDESPSDKIEKKDENPFSILSDQKKRRVYTSVPEEIEGQQKSYLQELGLKGKKDFSYSEMSHIFHNSMKNNDLDSEEIDESIRSGSEIPLKDGPIPLDKNKDKDLQLVPFHLLSYQNFHTPPNLKSQKRKKENRWRQQELDNTRKWMQLPKSEGLNLMLPKIPENGEKFSTLRNIYPGPIDIGFPPNDKKTLFNYAQNKSVYLLNKEMLLSSSLKHDEFQKRKPKKVPSSRKILTDSFFETIKKQEDSTATSPESYVKKTFGLKRSDSMESLDMSSSDEESDVDVVSIYDKKKPLKQLIGQKKTFLNTLGLQVKLQNRKILQDMVAIEEAKKESDSKKLDVATTALRKHQKLLRKLESKHEKYFRELKPKFDDIEKKRREYENKKKILKKINPKSKEGRNRKRKYIETLDSNYEEISINKIKKAGPLSGIGKKTLEKKLLSEEESHEKPKRKKRRKE